MGEPRRTDPKAPGEPVLPAPQSPDDARQGNAASAPAIVPGKSCGSCTTCCTVMGVPELNKRPWDECPHVAAGIGCKIYSERPACCRLFICGWLLDPHMGPDLKPENCHVVFYQLREQHIVATCDAAYPHAWREPNVLEFLHRLAKANAPHRKVILMEKGRLWYVTENAVVPTDTG
jgi:hypothetical protein